MQGHYQIIKSRNVGVEFFSLFQSTSHHWGFSLTWTTNTQNVSYTPVNFLKYKFILIKKVEPCKALPIAYAFLYAKWLVKTYFIYFN